MLQPLLIDDTKILEICITPRRNYKFKNQEPWELINLEECSLVYGFL